MEFPLSDGATSLDPDEADDLIPPHISTLHQLNEWEGTNILRAEEWIFAQRRKNILTEGYLKRIHFRMFDETWRWAGKYRRSDKNIGVHWLAIPEGVRQTLDNALYWIANETFELDEIAVRLHHGMVTVHPFPNGNGRCTRLIADALLHSHSKPRFTWGRADLQSANSSARLEYLAALKSADLGRHKDLLRFARS